MAAFSWLRSLLRGMAARSAAAGGGAVPRVVVAWPCPDCGGRRFLVRRSDTMYARMTCATCGSSFELPYSLIAGTEA
jgi:DNA-directed RNA polymerase subunit RPC12/RpoP